MEQAKKNAKNFYEAISGSRSIPFWVVLAVAPLWADHLNLLEIDDLSQNPLELGALVGLVGTIWAAWKNGSSSRRGDD